MRRDFVQALPAARSGLHRPERFLAYIGCALSMLSITTAASAAMFGSITQEPEPTDLAVENWSGALYGHERIYFALGGGEDFDARFQLSLKARVWDHWFVGYSQTSIWDLYKESKPFRDSSYRPSIFYHHRKGPDDGAWTPNISAGFEHESNGRDGSASRSISIVFVRPDFEPGDPTGFHWQLGAKLYAYVSREENNGDIRKYRGFGDYYVRYGHPDNWEVSVTARKGTASNYGSALVEASIPMKTFIGNFKGDLFIQYFQGYGETILQYNQRSDPQIRIGYQVWRER